MKLIYVVINFVILIALLAVFAGRGVVAMFRKRREDIEAALDKAEAEEKAVPELPGEDNIPSPSADEGDPVFAEISTQRDAALSLISSKLAGEITEARLDCAEEMKKVLASEFAKKARELFSSEKYGDELKKRESEMTDMILSAIKLTPGDMAYLKYHDVLYVTLTTAREPENENVIKIKEATDSLLASVGGKTSYWVRQDPALIGGMTLRIGDTIYDCSVAEELYQISLSLEKCAADADETPESLAEKFGRLIKEKHSEVRMGEYQLGRVLTVSDGICWMDGLADIMYGEVVEFECGERGMVLDIQHDKIGCVIYGRFENIESGSRVRRVGRIASVAVGDELLGRVLDPLGHPIDGLGRLKCHERRPIEFRAPGIPDRSPVNKPLHTGIKAIDALVPIGRGQRELIIGDRQTGKTSIVLDTILNQRDTGVVCIYCAIGQKETTVADVRAKLEKYGGADYTVIVAATASDSASLQYVAPFAATAMGEYFMYSGRDVLIIYDDLSKHAVAYRELSLLLHRPSGREAYPGDIFYLHSRLLERSAHLSDELGGGSMTALPIIETLAGDISSYIPTNVISITDGQIFLDTDLFYEGQRPAVNAGLSVSRVGSAAQTKLFKQVSSSLRVNLAQYRELAGFAQFGSDMDEETKRVLAAGERMTAALRQRRYSPIPDWKQALLIYSVSEGFADSVGGDEIDEYESGLYSFVDSEECAGKYAAVIGMLKSGRKMTADDVSGLRAMLGDYVSSRAAVGKAG